MVRKMRAFLLRLGVVTLLGCGAAQAAEPAEAQPSRHALPEDPYQGVVLNQTITVAGQEFYQYFIAAWRDRDAVERIALSIHERPSARWGTQIWVESAQRRVFQAALPTQRASIRALCEQAVEIVYEQATAAEVERLLFRDADLGPDEI